MDSDVAMVEDGAVVGLVPEPAMVGAWVLGVVLAGLIISRRGSGLLGHAGQVVLDTGVIWRCKGRPRIFGAVQYVWNGWVKELPAGRFRGRSIEKILQGEAR